MKGSKNGESSSTTWTSSSSKKLLHLEPTISRTFEKNLMILNLSIDAEINLRLQSLHDAEKEEEENDDKNEEECQNFFLNNIRNKYSMCNINSVLKVVLNFIFKCFLMHRLFCFSIQESKFSFIENVCKASLKINNKLNKSKDRIQKYKHNSTTLKIDYSRKSYERNNSCKKIQSLNKIEFSGNQKYFNNPTRICNRKCKENLNNSSASTSVKSRKWTSSRSCLRVSWMLHLLILMAGCSAAPILPPESPNITRLEAGDAFFFRGAECMRRECGGRTESLSCACACPSSAPLFREDAAECVADISECNVAPFGTGSSSQRVPYVFLPLKGQIIHPSKEISFPGVRTPICAVSGAQFLTKNGFVDLRNSLDSDVPFALFRDEGRTFLQWTGEGEIRSRMEGRLIVVQLLCRDVGAPGLSSGPGALSPIPPESAHLHGVFAPCAAFRVAGSPPKHVANVSEVLFSPDARSSEDTASTGLTMTEYIAIGVSSILLGLIYVASVFLYLHIKKRRTKSEISPDEIAHDQGKGKKDRNKRKSKEIGEREHIGNENGVVKNNPLLGIGRHFHERHEVGRNDFQSDSGSSPSDSEEPQMEQRSRNDNVQQMSHMQVPVTVHPISREGHGRKTLDCLYHADYSLHRDECNMERHPEENISIIETMDMRDDKPELVRAMGTTRRKLYFNPAYFEPHLLMSPPPAAVEFLMKIREVISIAKHKMATRRFTPSLRGIPEEDTYHTVDRNLDFYHIGSQRSSVVSLKRENIRRRPYCSGCPGCDSKNIQDHSTYTPDFTSLGACHSCSSTNGVNKQISIRKWLEGVPILKSSSPCLYNIESEILSDTHIINKSTAPNSNGNGLLNSLLSLPKDSQKLEASRKCYSYSSRSLYAEDTTNNFIFKKKTCDASIRSEPTYCKFNIPLPSLPPTNMMTFREPERTIAKIKDISPIGLKLHDKKIDKIINERNQIIKNQTMPDMINEALEIDKNKVTTNFSFGSQATRSNVEIVSTTSKLQTQSHFVTNKPNSDPFNEKKSSIIDYETDSLERSHHNKGLSTPTDYADVSSSQASPNLSSALPMDEELTMRNAIYKLSSGSRSTSRVSTEDETKSETNQDLSESSATFITNAFDNLIYNLPTTQDANGDYSLVSEVYVNNGYNFGSAPTSPSDSEFSTFGRRKAMIKYNEPEKPGHLTIEVKDPPENYIKIHESDGFEPDTLDRKPNKLKLNIGSMAERKFILNPLPEGNGMEIKATGVFKSASLSCSNSIGDAVQSNRNFGSLREIYETKTNSSARPSVHSLNFIPSSEVESRDYELVGNENTILDTDEGRLLTLESRHFRRQRQSTPPTSKGDISKLIPPDIIPPEECVPIYEYPKPPRKVIAEHLAPPLPPKNEGGRSPIPRRVNYKSNNNKAVKDDARKLKDYSPQSTLSDGLDFSPSGASVKSAQSSDYENIIPINDTLLPPHGKTLSQCVRTNIDEEHLKAMNKLDAITSATNPNVVLVCSPSKAPSKAMFRELQTPKAGRKPRQSLSPRKQTKSESFKKAWRRTTGNQYKEDSGYLSTDSNDSRRNMKRRSKGSGSETDESVEDARSESGAESIETHSVFFGSFRKMSLIASSVDSGMGAEIRLDGLISPTPGLDGEHSPKHDSDCEETNRVSIGHINQIKNPIFSERRLKC